MASQLATGTVATGEDFFTVAVASAVHQLRTPLSVVTGFTELMALRWDEGNRDELRAMLDVLARNAARMGDLVEDLLVLATLHREAMNGYGINPDGTNAGGMNADGTNTNGSNADGTNTDGSNTDSDAAGVLDAAADSARARGIAVEVRCPETLRIDADPDRVEQIVATLVDNACQHGRPPVIITAETDPDGISISVTDAGAGVANRDVPGLFQPFSAGSAPSSGSHGLGLYAARRSARGLRGDLFYIARPFGGTFVLTLPVGPKSLR